MNIITLSDKLKSEISQLNKHFQNVRENQVLDQGGGVVEDTIEVILNLSGFVENTETIVTLANILDQGFNIESVKLQEAAQIASSKMVLEGVLDRCGYPVQYEPEPETKWQ